MEHPLFQGLILLVVEAEPLGHVDDVDREIHALALDPVLGARAAAGTSAGAPSTAFVTYSELLGEVPLEATEDDHRDEEQHYRDAEDDQVSGQVPQRPVRRREGPRWAGAASIVP